MLGALYDLGGAWRREFATRLPQRVLRCKVTFSLGLDRNNGLSPLNSGCCSYVLFAKGIEVIGPTAASSYVFLVPVFGVLGGWILLGEEIGASMLIGFVLIVVGVTEVQRESERLSAFS